MKLQRLVILGLLTAIGCGGPAAPPAPVIVAVTPPTPPPTVPAPTPPPKQVAPTPLSSNPPTPTPQALSSDVGGKALSDFLAPRLIPDATSESSSRPQPATLVPLEAPLPSARLALPIGTPMKPTPMLPRPVGPRLPPEPQPPLPTPGEELSYALSPRTVQPWRVPPTLDPLAPLPIPATPRAQAGRGSINDPSADRVAERIVMTPLPKRDATTIVPSRAKPGPKDFVKQLQTIPTLEGELGTRPADVGR